MSDRDSSSTIHAGVNLRCSNRVIRSRFQGSRCRIGFARVQRVTAPVAGGGGQRTYLVRIKGSEPLNYRYGADHKGKIITSLGYVACP